MALSIEEMELETTELLPERQVMTGLTLNKVTVPHATESPLSPDAAGATGATSGGGPLGLLGPLKDGLVPNLGQGQGQGGGGGGGLLPVGQVKDSVMALPKQELFRHLFK